jgi:hypothetical protein
MYTDRLLAGTASGLCQEISSTTFTRPGNQDTDDDVLFVVTLLSMSTIETLQPAVINGRLSSAPHTRYTIEHCRFNQAALESL